jgi:acetyl esterase/lipase
MSSPILRPPVDPALARALKAFGPSRRLGTKEGLEISRKNFDFSLSDVLQGATAEAVVHEQREIPGPAGPLTVSIFRPAKSKSSPAAAAPGILYLHGGGFCTANRFLGVPLLWVEEFDAVCVTVEYRLAPEHPQPAQIEDCYAALKWMSENSSSVKLGFDPHKLVVMDASAGGGLSAGTALLARDRGGPEIRGQMLLYPMLDDRNDTLSARQFAEQDPWPRANNLDGWSYALGENRAAASIYTAPARATDLSRLPSAYIDVGEADILRDEDIAYASALWKSGVSTELHVWPGAWHGFEFLAPTHPLTSSCLSARKNWLRRLFRDEE